MSFPLPTSLSPSKVSSFKDCALAFRYSAIDKLPEPPSPWTVKGTLVHRALELLFWENEQGARTPAVAMASLDRAWLEIQNDPEFIELALPEAEQVEMLDAAHTLVDNYFLIEDPNAVHVMGTELYLETQVGSMRLRGIIDRLDLTPDGELVITDYKGLAVDTPLPTPTGWTTMGDVRVGDQLLGADGRPTRVVDKSQTHWRVCYRLTFDDATSIVCDNEHLWSFTVGSGNRAVSKVLNTDEIFHMWEDGVRPFTIPNAAPLDLPEADLPIDPYVLGVWLGDGSSRQGYLHCCAEDAPHFQAALSSRGERVIDRTWPSAAARGMRVLAMGQQNPALCIRGHATRFKNRPDGRLGDCVACSHGAEGFPTNGTLYARLRGLGLRVLAPEQGRRTTKLEKRVPGSYLRASYSQRLDLLRGLMDTDGYWNPGRRQAVFSTVRPQLATAVADLVCGLGARAYTYAEVYENAKGKATKFQVIFTPTGFNPFTLARKANDAETLKPKTTARRRAIAKIEVVETVPTECVAVDAADSLYLAGSQMVPTHNTGRAPAVAYENARLGGVQFYSFLCERVLGRRPARIQLLHLAEPVAIMSTPTEQSTRGLEQRALAVWQAIERACEREDFRPKPSGLCDYCAYKAQCPAWGGSLENNTVAVPA